MPTRDWDKELPQLLRDLGYSLELSKAKDSCKVTMEGHYVCTIRLGDEWESILSKIDDFKDRFDRGLV